MKKSNYSGKELIVVGDRLLVVPDENREKTSHGLYLPQGIEAKEKVHSGLVFKKGPGYPIPDPGGNEDHAWTGKQHDINYMPLQVEEGDYIIYMRKSAIEIELDGKKYVIVPHYAVLLIIRSDLLDEINGENNFEK